MPIQIQYRRGTAAQWGAANTILASGEPGYETDTGKFKVGNGVTGWNALSYSSGPIGNTGVAGNVTVGTTTTLTPNTPPTVTNSGNGSYAILNFAIPRNNTVTLGTTSTLAPNTPPSVTNGGTAADIILNFAIPRNNTVALGTVTTLSPNTPPTVTNGGTTSDIILNFGIPRPNTVTVGTTSTLAPGSAAAVTNGGTAADIQLNFALPRGNVGNMAPKSISIFYPSAGENQTFFYNSEARTIARMASILVPLGTETGPSANFSVRYANVRNSSANTPILASGLLVSNTGNANVMTTFTNATIPAGAWVWVTTSAATANTAELHITLDFV